MAAVLRIHAAQISVLMPRVAGEGCVCAFVASSTFHVLTRNQL